jgi:uncharacterized membrane protein
VQHRDWRRISPRFAGKAYAKCFDLKDKILKGKAMSEPNQSGLTDNVSGLSDNAAGAIAYLTFIPAVIFLIVEPFNKSAFVRFHSWQCILLSVVAFVINIALSILMGIAMVMLPFFVVRLLWPVIELAWFLVWLLCVVNAYNGKMFKLPIIGNFAAKQSGN